MPEHSREPARWKACIRGTDPAAQIANAQTNCRGLRNQFLATSWGEVDTIFACLPRVPRSCTRHLEGFATFTPIPRPRLHGVRSCVTAGVNAAIAGLGLLFASAGFCAEPLKPLEPLPTRIDVDPGKVALGKRLVHDPGLSEDGSIACASYHDLATDGDDGQVVSLGMDGRRGLVNTPTAFNVRFNIEQFWDGRADTLDDQVDGPVHNEAEMASLWPDIVKKLEDDEIYPGLFAAVYPGQGISRATTKNAIAEFERSPIIPNSRFDQWLSGDDQALSREEKQGYKLLKQYGCSSSHRGRNVGGNMFQVFGVLNNYFAKRGNMTPADMGRFNVTGKEGDLHVFRVSSLRMIVHTPPHLHDGSAETLQDAVDAMFESQFGGTAPHSAKNAIVAFIGTLAGEEGATN